MLVSQTFNQTINMTNSYLHAALNTHLLGGEVGVETRTVPVARDGLGLDRDLGTEFFGDTVEKEPSHPKLVTHLNTHAGTDLELPLGRHNLGVGTGDLDSCIQAGLVVCVDDVTTHNPTCADTTVVRTLGSRESVLGPTVRSVLHIEESVLLLKTKPWYMAAVGLHQLGTFVTVVVFVGGAIGVPALSQDQDVRDTSHGVRVDGDRSEIDITVVTGSLIGRRTVEVPDGEILGLDVAILGNRCDGLNVKSQLAHILHLLINRKIK